MDEDSGRGEEDGLGIRVSGNSLPYSTGASSAWVGAGIINKPIGDFFTGTFDRSLGARFAANNSGSIRVVVNSQVIPEPEEYALVFGLFALGLSLPATTGKGNNGNKPQLRSYCPFFCFGKQVAGGDCLFGVNAVNNPRLGPRVGRFSLHPQTGG